MQGSLEERQYSFMVKITGGCPEEVSLFFLLLPQRST